jgi:hypothetical protein
MNVSLCTSPYHFVNALTNQSALVVEDSFSEALQILTTILLSTVKEWKPSDSGSWPINLFEHSSVSELLFREELAVTKRSWEQMKCAMEKNS